MAVLSKVHPLHKYINHQGTSKVKRYKGPLHHLLKWFKPEVKTLEKVPTMIRDPMKIGKIPLKISIAESREDSIKEIVNAPEPTQVFSDGSVLEGKVGISAVLFIKGRHIKSLHYHLGQDTQHMVHKAELVGLVLELHLLNSRKYSTLVAMVSIENQVAIKALTSDLRSPGHHLVCKAL